jgi:NAD dependent epimerase/dehydratase family enzyme
MKVVIPGGTGHIGTFLCPALADDGHEVVVLTRLARLGLGGAVAGGRQYLSWIHEHDLVRVVRFLIARDDLAGPVNVTAPNPLPQRDFMRALRGAWHLPAGLPATRWIAELGAVALRSDTELLLKSRRVVPGRLSAAGLAFTYPDWPRAGHEPAERTFAGRAAR